ncbi:hypothetical protein AJ88_48455 [Mesorhizobium amorphae CCBAU 01583]|nr:hypothetical protein AJ88_48455 [Mesorhizobium amorphae CCBAU 01583]
MLARATVRKRASDRNDNIPHETPTSATDRIVPLAARVIAVFSYRFDAHLVSDLIANLDPIVDGWIAYDDRKGRGLSAASRFGGTRCWRRRATLPPTGFWLSIPTSGWNAVRQSGSQN